MIHAELDKLSKKQSYSENRIGGLKTRAKFTFLSTEWMFHKLVDQTKHVRQPLKMVNISGKSSIHRMAKAEGKIWLQPKTIAKIRLGQIKKGRSESDGGIQ